MVQGALIALIIFRNGKSFVSNIVQALKG